MLESFFFIVGLLFGSFANVCILRLPKDEDIFFLKSKCFNCKKKFSGKTIYHYYPILSLAGVSECCQKKISLQYPIIEISNGMYYF